MGHHLLRELLKKLNGIPRADITEDAFGEIYQYSATYDQDAQDSIGVFDFVMANPPFNVNGVDREKIKSDRAHYPFGVP